MSSVSAYTVASCIVSEIQRDIGRKPLILTHPTCILRPAGGDSAGISPTSSASVQKTRVVGYGVALFGSYICLAVLVVLQLLTDRRTGRRDGHITTAYTALAQCRVVKSQVYMTPSFVVSIHRRYTSPSLPVAFSANLKSVSLIVALRAYVTRAGKPGFINNKNVKKLSFYNNV